MGVLRFQIWLDLTIEHFAERSVSRLDLPVKLALRLGLYQLRFLTRVPQSAAVNESVNLVHSARLRSAASFVNAVLRRATREPGYDPVATISDPIKRLSVSTSHPRWLVDRWQRFFGFQEAESLAIANNQPAPLAFRVVHPEAEQQIVERLRQSGAILSPSEIAAGGWRIERAGELTNNLARAGEIYFQDEASQLVAHVVAVQPGERILDVCAAPGSKTTQMASIPHSKVVAGDVHLHRINTVLQAAKTQNLANVTCLVLNGDSDLPFQTGSFDRVLVDAPCSGTGTLRHNPEIRWRISEPDIRELSQRQRNILENAARVVKPGGRLVYSTCSVEPEENEAVVKDFSQRNRDFESVRLPVEEKLLTSENTARTWPHRDDADGFFIAAFIRRKA
jgi:16S rRNA (cytosine967-C5)-methyltransferase